MDTMFEYARKRIKKQYTSHPEYFTSAIKEKEAADLSYIDMCEEKAKNGYFVAIKYELLAFWRAQSGSDKNAYKVGCVFWGFVTLIFLCFSASTIGIFSTIFLALLGAAHIILLLLIYRHFSRSIDKNFHPEKYPKVERIKRKPNMKNIRLILLLVVYVFTLIISTTLFVPYKVTETSYSSQNVPHSIVTQSSFDNIFEVIDRCAYGGKYTKNGREILITTSVNYPQLTLNLAIPTVLFIVFLIVAKRSDKKGMNEEIKRLSAENEELRQIIEAQKQRESTEDIHCIRDYPSIDINALAFATEKDQEAALIKYKREVLAFVERRIHNALYKDSTGHQLNFDVVKPPYLDYNELASADEERQKELQEQYAKEMYTYIKAQMSNEGEA